MHLIEYNTLKLEHSLLKTDECQGTIIRIEEINLKGFGESGLEALIWKLANYFSLENLGERSIKIKVVQNDEDLKKEYETVTKNISFKNMFMLTHSDSNTNNFVKNIEALQSKIEFKPTKLKKIEYNHEEFKFERIINSFPEITKGKIEIKNQLFEYELKGWIAIHSSLKGDNFIVDDGETTYSKFYNPNQLRLYIRNKLAVENLIPKLKNTQAFANYIEGEISFEVLDNNELNDITTSNRQDIDENDERVAKLIEILKSIINNLINERTKIANTIKNKEKDLLGNIANNNKTELIRKAKKQHFNEEVIEFIEKNAKGEILKNTARIFISHDTDNKAIVDFIYSALKYLGASEEEIFYTSKNINPFTEQQRQNSIIKAMKENITDMDTLILYFITPSFLDKRFTLFESGAGWVTKGKDKFIIFSNNLKNVKSYLEILYEGQSLYSYSNDEMFIKWLSKDDIHTVEYDEIDINIHNYNHIIVPLFNTCINHLNEKRKINNIPLIQKLEQIEKWEDANFELLNLWTKYFNQRNYDKHIKTFSATVN